MKILNNKREPIEKLDFGILEAGKTKNYKFTVYNETSADVTDIKFEIDHAEVTVVSSPEKMYPKSDGTLILAWNPSLTLKKGLQAIIKVKAVELYR